MQGKTGKIILWTTIFILLLAGIGTIAFLLLKPRTQTMALSDGTKVTLAGVTFGQHHKFPGKTRANGGRGMTIDTPTDTLCVWLRQVQGKQRGPMSQLMVFDSAGTACVGQYARRSQKGDLPNEEISGVNLTAFPRRDRKIVLRFQTWNPKGGYELSEGSFVIANPARSTYPKWTPESLPITQTDGDLEMTLTRLESGSSFGGGYQNQEKKGPISQGVLAAFRLEQKGLTVTNWQPVKIKTSDATGNVIANSGWSNRHENGEEVMVYQWGLWPDEPAWKLHVEFSRTSGFTDAECWTVKDIPVEKGNLRDRYRRDIKTPVFAETTIEGTQLKLYTVKVYDENRGMGMEKEGELQINLEPAPDDMRLTAVKITDDQGREIEKYNRGYGSGYNNFGLRKLGNAKTISITVALHRSRFADFTAKPAKQ